MSKGINKYIIHNIFDSIRGKTVVSKALKEQGGYDKEDIRFIVFPECNDDYFKYGTIYLDEYLLRDLASLAIVFYCDEELESYLGKNVSSKYKSYKLDRKDMECIITLNRLISLDSLMKIVSLDLPDYRNGRNLLSYNKIDVEQIIGIGIYRLLPFSKIKRG